MKKDHEMLEKLFHEPARLAILTELCSVRDGLAFTDLKTRCNLTDGNLSRHISALQTAKIVKVDKRFEDSKPKTTVILSSKGREDFLAYLAALEGVLKLAVKRIEAVEKTERRADAKMTGAKPAKA